MISSKDYGEILTEIEEISKNHLDDSYLRIQQIQKLLRNFRLKHVALVLPSIKKIVANAYLLTPESLNVVTRADTIKSARQMAMWFYYHYTKKSLSNIGLEFSDGRHAYSHCTVLFSVGKVDDLCDVDKTLREERLAITRDIELYYKKVERKKEQVFTMQN